MQRVRKFVAVIVSAVLPLGCLPSWVCAAPPAKPAAATAAAPESSTPVSIDEVRELFKSAGATDDLIDRALVDKSKGKLSPIGLLLYPHMKQRYAANLKEYGKAVFTPLADIIKANGGKMPALSQDVYQEVKKTLGSMQSFYDPNDPESSYAQGAKIEALITGLARTEHKGTPNVTYFTLPDGSLRVSGDDGALQVVEKGGRVGINYELQKMQRKLNQLINTGKWPKGADRIPETGRYNKEFLMFPYWQLRAALDAQYAQMRDGRIQQLIQLLQLENKFTADMISKDPDAMMRMLEERARGKKMVGTDVYILDYVEDRWLPMRMKLREAVKALDKYLKDIEATVAKIQKFQVFSEADGKFLEKGQKEVQKLFRRVGILAEQVKVDNLKLFLDPTQPDYLQYRASLIEMLGSEEEAKKFEATLLSRVKPMHEGVSRVLQHAGKVIDESDSTPKSLGVQEAMTNAADRAFQEFIEFVKPYHDTLSMGQSLRAQVETGKFGWLETKFQQIYAHAMGDESFYSQAMKANRADWAKMPQVIGALTVGDVNTARQTVIDMHPEAVNKLTASDKDITNAMRAEAAFSVMSENVAVVSKTNSWIKVGAAMTEFVVLAPLGGVVVKGLQLIAKVESIAKAMKGASDATNAIGDFLNAVPGMNLLKKTVGFPVILLKEMSLHSAARIGMVLKAGEGAGAVRGAYLIARSMAVLQAKTLIGGGIVMGGLEATMRSIDVNVRGEESIYGDARTAFVEGFVGGVTTFGAGLFPFLPFVGVPITAIRRVPVFGGLFKLIAENPGFWGFFGQTFRAGARFGAEKGSQFFRGVGLNGLAKPLSKFEMSRLLATAEEKAAKGVIAKRSFYTKLQAVPIVGFVVTSTDHMARFMAFNSAVQYAGWQYGYRVKWEDQDDPGQRLKGAHATSLAWEQSPWWAFLPTASADVARRNMAQYRSFQGAMEYEKAGKILKVLNAEGPLPFKKVSLWRRLFDPSAELSTGSFEVTAEVRDWARGRALIHQLGGRQPEDVHFMELYRITKVKDGNDQAVGIKANAELRAAANASMTQSLVARSNAREVGWYLNRENLGKTSKEGHVLTEAVQEALAFAILAAPNVVRRTASRELRVAAREALEPYVRSAATMEAPAQKLVRAVDAARKGASQGRKDSLEEALQQLAKQVNERAKGDQGLSAAEVEALLEKIVSEIAQSHNLNKPSRDVLDGIVGYMHMSAQRFGYANNGEMVSPRLRKTLGALENQFSVAGPTRDVVAGWRNTIENWIAAHGRDTIADNKELGAANPFKAMTDTLAAELAAAPIAKHDRDALQDALKTIGSSPWVIRDDKGFNIPGWRSEQLIGIVELLSNYAGQRVSGSKGSRLYQLMATGSGKTLTQFIGILPLAERIAEELGLQRVVYSTIAPLKSQAVNDFVAFRVAGTKLEFSSPEDVKAEIAQGKLERRDVVSKMMLIGDEADKPLFEDPQTSLGMLSGTITRLNSTYRRIEERLDGLLGRVDMPRIDRMEQVSAAARKMLDKIDRENGISGEAREKMEVVVAALTDFAQAKGAEASRAEERVAAAVRQLQGELPSASKDVRDTFDGFDQALRPSAIDGKFKRELHSELKDAFAEDRRSLGAFDGRQAPLRLMRESFADLVALETRIAVLESNPANEQAVAALKKQIKLLKKFSPEATDRGLQIALLQDKVAEVSADYHAAQQRARLAGESNPVAPEQLPAWSRRLNALTSGLSGPELDAVRAHRRSAQAYHESRAALPVLSDRVADAMQTNNGDREGLKDSYRHEQAQLPALRQEAERAAHQLSADAINLGQSAVAIAAGSATRGVRRSARGEIRKRIRDVQDLIVAEEKNGEPGWQNRVEALLESYKSVVKAYGGHENPVYTTFRDLHETMRSVAYRLNSDPTDEVAARQYIQGRWRPAALLRMLLQIYTGREINPGGADVGQARFYAARLLQAMREDSTMPESVKGELFWPLMGALFGPHRSSWVAREMTNQYDGFFESPTAVYSNPRNGGVFTRFNGQIIPNMDIPTRRYWEVNHGADLTLPYAHEAVASGRDITHNPRANFFFFSATIEKPQQLSIEPGVRVSGKPVPLNETPIFHPVMDFGQKADMVLSAIHRENQPGDYVTVPRSEIPRVLRGPIDAYLLARDISPTKNDAYVLNLRELDPGTSAALMKYLQRREWQGKGISQKGLVSVFCSDTKAVMEMRANLIANGLNPKEITMIYSDVEYEKANGDAKKVEEMMNKGALDSGRTKVLLIDSSYVIRGIDMNFKGARDGFLAGHPELGFAGYNHNSMLFFGADQNTYMQIVQGAGRTSPRRALPGMTRDFTISVDVPSAKLEPVFAGMQRSDAFKSLLADAGGAHSWEELNSALASGRYPAAAARYQKMLGLTMETQWDVVTQRKMTASGFSEQAAPAGSFREGRAIFGTTH